MLHGRVKERAAIEAMLARARAGQGGCLVLRGEPGIGKTALLDHTAEHAVGMRVLRTVGVEPEYDLGYATLHRLLLPVLDRIEKLPEPQAHGLGVVFGQAAGPAPDRFLVALATLSLLSEAAEEQPLLCLVDDAHWADAPSLDTLAFVARRLDAEPIALALAARADEGRPLDVAGLVDVPLAGLDRDAAVAVLAESGGGGLSAVERDEVLRATGGNPLAIREMPASAPRGVGLGEPLPLAAGLQRAFLERARQRDPAAQRLLLLIAADGSGRLDTIRRAASYETDAGPPDLGVLADLIVEDGPRLVFRHPLIRSAIYHGASPADRRGAHQALAAVVGSDPDELDRRAWHRGQAADGPDEQVAAELERSAERTLRRAGPAAAAAAFERAAELSASRPDRARRLAAAAHSWWEGGDAAHAAAKLDESERLDPLPESVRLDVAALRALIDLRSGIPDDAVARLRPLIADVLEVDRHRAVYLMGLFGEACFHANAAEAYAGVGPAVERVPLDGGDTDDVLLRLVRAAYRVRAGEASGLEHADLATIEHLTDPVRLCWAGGLAWGVGDPELARRLRGRAVRRARALGAAGPLAWALEYLVVDEVAFSRFDVAEAYAEEGHRFAVETGQTNMACRHQSWLALLAAVRGREDEARRLAEEALAAAAERRLAAAAATAHRALGLLDLAAGRPAEAMKHLEAPYRGGESTHPGLVLYSVPELVEAAVRANQPGRAAAPFDRYAAWSDAMDAPELRALTARCRALLAAGDTAGDTAESEFRLALQLHDQADWPMERARTELLFGEHLRRERRRSEARPYLRSALETFGRLGASVWADRAREELRATGETARREQSTLPVLTPQERRIAAAVSEGATNREVAAQLFLSPRTVDYHLRKVFQKVGISSRAELIRLSLAGGGGKA